MPTPPEATTGTGTASDDRAREREVEARLGAVAVHRGEQDLAGAVVGHAPRPVDRVEPGALAAAMGEDLPFAGRGLAGVDRHHDALVAVLLGRLAHELGPRHGGGVDRDLVGAGQQQAADVLDRAHAAAHGERHEALLGGAADDVEDRVAVLVAGGDVEEGELVGAGGVVDPGLLDRIAGIAQVDELHALDRRGRP